MSTIDPARDARPQMHFTAPKNWLNDPNGLIRWGDTYHLFYQHNPAAPVHASIHWGHATSKDLITWKHLPPALAPDSEWDIAGCFSGCCVDDDGVATIVYTGIAPNEDGLIVERVLIATSTDNLMTWTKRPDPVIAEPPAEIDAVGFRDPSVWRQTDGTWHMMIGSGDRSRGGMLLGYTSTNLTDWEYRGVLLEQGDLDGNPLTAGTVWECPTFVRHGDRDILVFSPCDETGTLHVVSVSGAFEGDRFIPDGVALVDLGDSIYAPQVLNLVGERSVAFGWLRETNASSAPLTWSGAMSIAREWSVAADGSLAQAVVPELEAYRRPLPIDGLVRAIDGGASVELPERGALDVQLTLDIAAGGSVELSLGNDQPASAPVVRIMIAVDAEGRAAFVRRSPSAPASETGTRARVELRLLIDESIVEGFLPSGATTTLRFYPAGACRGELTLQAADGVLEVADARAWTLQPVGSGVVPSF